MGIGNMLKRSVLVGLGVLGLAKKRTDVVVEQVGKQTAVAEKEGKVVARALVKESKKQGKKLQDTMNAEMGKVLDTPKKKVKRRKG